MPQNPYTISYLTLRRSIGWLGITLPVILVMGTFILGDCRYIESSISHYYYTGMRDVFVGLLTAISLFLISYKGYDKGDHISTNIAGFFALCVALFPTFDNGECSGEITEEASIRTIFHYIAAGLFLGICAYISYFRFTISTAFTTKNKRNRNLIYKVCGINIISCIALIGIFGLIQPLHEATAGYDLTFWLECIALMSFGYSWIIKGEQFFKDT